MHHSVRYYLGVLLKAYEEFEDRVDYLRYRTQPKAERITAIIDRIIGKFTKKEIRDACPDISKITIERTLAALVKDVLMYLTRFNEQGRFGSGQDMAWKGYDFDIINELEEEDYIRQGSQRSKYVAITDEGIKLSRELLAKYNILDWK